MRFEDLNWFDIENYLKQDDRLMLVLGACEQHGYNSLLTDVKIPLALADAAGDRSGVLAAPPLNFGSSPYFLAYPGTISLRISTLLDAVEDVVRSLFRHGFRRLLVLNGHSGNDPARLRLYELANELGDLRLAWYAWWESHSVQEVARRSELKINHANWAEAFPFTQVATLPGESKPPPSVPGLLGAEQARRVYGDGSYGGPYQADAAVMEAVFNAALQDVLHLLRFDS